jgi:hypothetical protein
MYHSAKASKPFPAAGRYTARTPDAFPAESFGASKAGFLTVDVSPTISGGDHDGYTIPYTRVSAKTWTNRDGVEESQLGRYFKACGVNAVIDGDPQAQAEMAEATANTLVTIDVDWVARDKGTGYELKGMKNFPKNADGTSSRTILLDGKDGRPTSNDPITGEPVAIRAFLEVTRFNQLTN